MQIRGSVDRCDESLVEGWVLIPDRSQERLAVDIILDNNTIGCCVADQFRPDLLAAGLGDGQCAFSFPMPGFVPKSEISRIAIRLSDSDVFLRNPTQVSRPTNGSAGATVSRFGGLWVDRTDWIDQLGRKHRRREISDELAVALFRFVRDGYVVIETAVRPDLIESLNAQIAEFWEAPPEGLLVETFEPDGELRTVPPQLALRAGRTKMLDVFAWSSLARQAIAAPKVMEFLTALFEDRPKAFQSLNFWNGSQQDIHKDSAYVKIDSDPMHLAASWLALEDVTPGSGQLEYYVGSHRAPDFLFGGSNKWMESHGADHERFLASLHEDAATYGHVREAFLARRGDVLIWHADLAHGGSQITQPGRSRQSLVTHFTAAADEPFYRRGSNYAQLDAMGCRFVSQYRDVVA